MVVDDEAFCLTTYRSLLEMCGIDVEHLCDFFIDSREALEYMKLVYQHKISYKYIFTDFSMPHLNGIEMTEAIRAFLTNDLELPKEK